MQNPHTNEDLSKASSFQVRAGMALRLPKCTYCPWRRTRVLSPEPTSCESVTQALAVCVCVYGGGSSPTRLSSLNTCIYAHRHYEHIKRIFLEGKILRSVVSWEKVKENLSNRANCSSLHRDQCPEQQREESD